MHLLGERARGEFGQLLDEFEAGHAVLPGALHPSMGVVRGIGGGMRGLSAARRAERN
ncbi:MAG: hypothetical protein BroJett026_03980 [Betaproteobacteria bacterium]|nr:MAG: hypothetical protein BroJett026_03980 [Betaproteobacteria bacterium]